MIHVIATINVKPEKRDHFLDIFKANIPKVRAEEGCLRYEPTLDAESDIEVQVGPRQDTVTIVEAWESLAHLKAHLAAPHMATYRQAVKDIVVDVAVQVLEPA